MATNIYTEQRKNFDDFIMNHEGRELKIILPPYFRDNVWACVAGKMQYNIEKVIALGSGGKIKFDLTRCRWIDPLPLMSILVEIANSRKQKIAIEIKVANPDHGAICSEIGPYQSSPNRLLWFLEQEGFFESLKTHFSEDRGLIYPDRKQREAYHNINVTPSYEDARCIPLTLFFFTDGGGKA
jgi:hypothetical protein